MKKKEPEIEWSELKKIWAHSSQTQDIRIQMSDFLAEVKGKISPFEMDAIQSDLATLKNAWTGYKEKISAFEKDAIHKDINTISRLLERILNLFRKSN